MGLKLRYASLIASGTKPSYERALNKRIQILNTFAVIWIHLVVFFVGIEFLKAGIIDYLKFNYLSFSSFRMDAFFAQSITGLFMIIIIYINSKYYFRMARTLFMVVAFVNFGLFTLLIDPGRYIEYYFVFISGMALAIYVKNTIPFLLMLLSFFVFLSPYYFYVVYPQEYIDRLLVPATFCIFLSIYLLINYFKKLNKSNENLLKLEKDKVFVEKINLEKKEAELRELSEFKNHFFVNLSHEIRTPLTLVNGYVQQILAEKTSAKVADKIKIINDQTNQMQTIINSIMDLSKMESNNFEFNFQETDLVQLVANVFNQFESLFVQKGIAVVFETQLESCYLAVDIDFISKSISNILSNAMKFTPQNGTVTLFINQTPTAITINITDDGIGIPEGDLENIFKPFYQSKNHITKSQGSGIGLAFTKKIIEAHQFEIIAKSNKGSQFVITIPKNRVAENFRSKQIKAIHTEAIKKEDTASTNNTSTKSNKVSVLVVEDHPEMQNYLRLVLKNYAVTQALNGKEALLLLEKNTFDLIITDFMMPIMDGETLVTEIKNQNIKTPIIVLTARTDNNGKLNMLRLGVDSYLHKPFLEEELHLQISNALKLYDNINQFENNLDTPEKDHLDNYAKKFNQELLDFLNENLISNLLSVELVADYFEVSKSTLNRKTKALLGQTTQELILEARLQAARKLLEENPFESKKNIAQEVGLSNATYLFEKLYERFGSVYQ